MVGLVLADGSTIGEWGTTATPNEAPKGARLFAHNEKALYFALKQYGTGRAKYWRQSVIAYEIDGRKISTAHRLLERSPPESALQSLILWANWLRESECNIGSLAGSAWSLWRSTIHHPLTVVSPKLDWRRVPMGGRQSMARPGIYSNINFWDIQAAYPSSMHRLAFPTKYYEADTIDLEDRDTPGFAEATVKIPRRYWGPLPMILEDDMPFGNLSFPTGSRLDGIWATNELRLARDTGAQIKIHRAWVGTGIERLFTNPWWDRIVEGRALPGLAGQLAKVTANALWGSFIVEGRATWLTWDGNKLVTEPDRYQAKPKSYSIAALLTAYVRERMFREAYMTIPIIGAHTDCVFVPDGHQPEFAGEESGCWRVKDTASELTLIDPQIYRYIRPDGTERFVVSGVLPKDAPKAFARFLRGKVLTKVPGFASLRA
jgi:hypothetical protein